jgi:hypothetical protein
VTGIAPVTWRESLPSLSDYAVTAVLSVQCGVDWLRSASWRIRDEIDEAVMTAARNRDDLAIDRLVLHSVPVLDDVPAEELAALNAAHADWLYRLDAAGALLSRARRPRVHRLIVGGGQRNFGVLDGMMVRRRGAWSHPDAAETTLKIIGPGGATTPLTGYDLNLDGPFGDADPSFYL